MEENYYQHKSGFSRRDFIKTSAILSFSVMAWPGNSIFAAPGRQLRAGAAVVDTTPKNLPVVADGGFLPKKAASVQSRLHARSLVLNDGKTSIAITIVDICKMPRELLDKAKQLAARATGISPENMLIASTHTHSAPCVTLGHGVKPDPSYAPILPGLLAKAIENAYRNLAPARIGWTSFEDFEHTNCRRWILRTDKSRANIFEDGKDRAAMHPGYQNPAYVGPSGPVDPAVSVLSLQSEKGQPIAVLANYSMHYKGSKPISADYYGRFSEKLKELVGNGHSNQPFVAIMSQGTSGDAHWMDYSKPKINLSLDKYADPIAERVYHFYKKINYHNQVPLAMRQRELVLATRLPDEKRLAWAKKIVAKMNGSRPRNAREVYAKGQVLLSNQPERRILIQSLRIGDLGISAIPCEVYGLTGLKIKAQSPLASTFNICLANGYHGYIPPPEQHKFGGYSSWPQAERGLEEMTEPKIVENLLEMFEQITGKPRRKLIDPQGPYVKSVLAMKPLAYWRMSEFSGPEALDISGNGNHGTYEDYIAFYLPGPDRPNFSGEKVNRAAHFAGGRVKADIRQLNDNYTVNMWIWNGFPTDARDVTGYIFSRGADGTKGDCLGIGGKGKCQGKLFFAAADGTIIEGTTRIPMKTWQHVVLMRDGEKLAIFLEGTVEISATLKTSGTNSQSQIFIGGSSENKFNFEGKIDEVALFNRPLKPNETA